MKIGFRTPNLKKRLISRTTGKLKRKAKKMINPLYGKKGMGFIKNPSKLIKSSIYHKTTMDPLKILSPSMSTTGKHMQNSNTHYYNKKTALILCLLGFIGLGGIHDFYLGHIGRGIIKLLTLNWFLIGTIIDTIQLLNNSYR